MIARLTAERIAADRRAANGAPAQTLRVAFLAGTLGAGGAEKQLWYMVRALMASGADVRTYCLTRGEAYEAAWKAMGAPLDWVGRSPNPLLRLADLTTSLSRFKPHIVQAAHFFTNLYVTVAARWIGAAAVGGMRNDCVQDVRTNGRWGPWLLRLPPSIIANSSAAKANAVARGARPHRIHVLPNVIDLADFDARAQDAALAADRFPRPAVIGVGRLVAAKRWDRLLHALAAARNQSVAVTGVIAGSGPERSHLETMADQLGLLPHGLRFLGYRRDVPALLKRSDLLAVTSDHEGLPNAAMEAMAAGIPVITTPAGGAAEIVEDGVTGYVVPFDDAEILAARIVQLTRSAPLRRRLGEAGRKRLEQAFSFETLAQSLLDIYHEIASRERNIALLNLLGNNA